MEVPQAAAVNRAQQSANGSGAAGPGPNASAAGTTTPGTGSPAASAAAAAAAAAMAGNQVAVAPVHAPPVEYSGPIMRDDALLSCLVILTRLFGNPKSPAALAASLPIGEEGLTPDLFLRAADRAGLSANKVRRPIEKIEAISLPAVLLLTEKRAVVMLNSPKK